MDQTLGAGRGRKHARPVAGAVVGQHPLHPDAAAAKPAHGPAQKGRLAFVLTLCILLYFWA